MRSRSSTMTKGGGRGKGRPRKIPEMGNPSHLGTNPAGSEEAECSNTVKVIDAEGEAENVSSIHHILELGLESSTTKQSEDLVTEAAKEAKAIQIEEEVVPVSRKRGMALGYIAPLIRQGIPTAKLEISEIEHEAEKWRNAVIFYVIGETPTIAYLTKFLHTHCEIAGSFEIFYHNEGYFVIKFELGRDKEKMLFEGPYMLASRPTIIKEWTKEFCFEKEVLKEIPLWVRLPKLPLTYWSGDSLSRIGSILGKPICADDCTSEQKRISYARLLIEVDITKPLTYKIQIEGEQGRMIEQQVYYEWVPMFCHKCHKVGHVCKERNPNITAPGQKQQWQRKDVGKTVVVEGNEDKEGWKDPKKPAAASIQVGHIQVPTGNGFNRLHDEQLLNKGGDLFPKVGT